MSDFLLTDCHFVRNTPERETIELNTGERVFGKRPAEELTITIRMIGTGDTWDISDEDILDEITSQLDRIKIT